MTVQVVMPVFNRLEMTRKMLACLRSQETDEPLHIIVVDDGSTDGTDVYLAAQVDVTVLRGDGNLWWGGAVDLALRRVFKVAAAGDWVLLANNDTSFDSGFVQKLLDAARRHAPAAVGSIIRDEQAPHRMLSIGACIDAWKLLITDQLVLSGPDGNEAPHGGVFQVDALSGRGVLFSVSALMAAGGMRPRWLPHYLGDYELSLRLQSQGCRLLVAMDAVVYSKEEYGNTYQAASLRDKFWSVRSPSYLPAVAVFWWEASNWPQRLTLPLRLLAFALFPTLRKKNENPYC